MEFQLITNQFFAADGYTFDRLVVHILGLSSFGHPQLGNSHKRASSCLVWLRSRAALALILPYAAKLITLAILL